MSYDRKPGRGVIFRDRKKTNANAPDFRSPRDCTVLVDGVEREVAFALWEKTSDKAGTYFAFSIEVKDEVRPDDRDEDLPL